ncbi:hypothetical protein ACSEE7_20350, partial [Halomonas cupida]|uniref:hypothetical protein n=2 Tax=Halomonas TaxID=2745 RepID=UPI003EF6EF7A
FTTFTAVAVFSAFATFTTFTAVAVFSAFATFATVAVLSAFTTFAAVASLPRFVHNAVLRHFLVAMMIGPGGAGSEQKAGAYTDPQFGAGLLGHDEHPRCSCCRFSAPVAIWGLRALRVAAGSANGP